MIRPELCTSEHFLDVSRDARLTFVLLQMHCDDAGVIPARPRKVQVACHPGGDASVAEVASWCAELVERGLLREFESNGETYWLVHGWHNQRIDRPRFSYPSPPFDDASTIDRRHVDDTSTIDRGHVDDTSTNDRGHVDDRSQTRRPEGRKEGRRKEGTRASARERPLPRASSGKNSGAKKLTPGEAARLATGFEG